MKKHLLILTAAILCFGFIPAYAQLGRMPSGPKFDATMAKLFDANPEFSATLVSQIKQPDSDLLTVPGKIFFDSGKTRMEMNLSDVQGTKIPKEAADQMKAMGMDQMVTITRPDKKSAYLIYPGLESYVEAPLAPAKTGTNDTTKVEETDLGKDTADGHPCVKHKVVVTDDKGGQREYTIWNATDLKKFPVQISYAEHGSDITMQFKNVTLTKPAASEFDLPANYTRYESIQTMMQTEMMKKLGGGLGMPPGH